MAKQQVESTQLKMGDLVDRVKLQQTELEVRYACLCKTSPCHCAYARTLYRFHVTC